MSQAKPWIAILMSPEFRRGSADIGEETQIPSRFMMMNLWLTWHSPVAHLCQTIDRLSTSPKRKDGGCCMFLS